MKPAKKAKDEVPAVKKGGKKAEVPAAKPAPPAKAVSKKEVVRPFCLLYRLLLYDKTPWPPS